MQLNHLSKSTEADRTSELLHVQRGQPIRLTLIRPAQCSLPTRIIMKKTTAILLVSISSLLGYAQSNSLEFRSEIKSAYQSTDKVTSLAKLVFKSSATNAFTPEEWAQLQLRNWNPKAETRKIDIVPAKECAGKGYDIRSYIEHNDRTLPISGLVVIHLKNATHKEKSDNPCDPDGWSTVDTNNVYFPYGVKDGVYYIPGAIKSNPEKKTGGAVSTGEH